MRDIQETGLGIIAGAAVGDALGAPTVGAVAGALLGAYHGFRDIPKRWWEALGPEMNTRLVNNTKGLLEIGTVNT